MWWVRPCMVVGRGFGGLKPRPPVDRARAQLDRIRADTPVTRRDYLLIYCSLARAGKHTVTIEAVTKSESGKLDYQFDANGFGPDCDATRPPPFDTAGRSVRSREKLGITDKSAANGGDAPKPAKAEAKVEAEAKAE